VAASAPRSSSSDRAAVPVCTRTPDSDTPNVRSRSARPGRGCPGASTAVAHRSSRRPRRRWSRTDGPDRSRPAPSRTAGSSRRGRGGAARGSGRRTRSVFERRVLGGAGAWSFTPGPRRPSGPAPGRPAPGWHRARCPDR
jgi:hypothetical protein